MNGGRFEMRDVPGFPGPEEILGAFMAYNVNDEIPLAASVVYGWPCPIPVSERLPDAREPQKQIAFRITMKPNEWLSGRCIGGIFFANGDWEDENNSFSPLEVIDWIEMPPTPE